MKVTIETDSRLLEWSRSGDTGTSSKTIASVLGELPWMGAFDPCVPCDPGDFGRCYRLLERMPEWRARLGEVADRYPAWRPLVREWARMEVMYREDLPTGESARLYDLMRELRAEGDPSYARAVRRSR